MIWPRFISGRRKETEHPVFVVTNSSARSSDTFDTGLPVPPSCSAFEVILSHRFIYTSFRTVSPNLSNVLNPIPLFQIWVEALAGLLLIRVVTSILHLCRTVCVELLNARIVESEQCSSPTETPTHLTPPTTEPSTLIETAVRRYRASASVCDRASLAGFITLGIISCLLFFNPSARPIRRDI